MIRNRARVRDDFPAPVRPTIPTYMYMYTTHFNTVSKVRNKDGDIENYRHYSNLIYNKCMCTL